MMAVSHFLMGEIAMNAKRRLTSEANKNFPCEFDLYGFGKRTLERDKRKPLKNNGHEHRDYKVGNHNIASGWS